MEPALSLKDQAAAMFARWPTFRAKKRNGTMFWTGCVQPQIWCDSYRIQVSYHVGTFPTTVVLDPPIQVPHDKRLECHVYSDNALCLFNPKRNEWNARMLIATSIIPWAIEWLYFYEVWLETGQWLGGGEHSDDHLKDPVKVTEASSPVTKRILSIDGGGIKGAFVAGFLARTEQLTGSKTWQSFDLVAGTSTGGIIALGLANRMPARDIVTLYRHLGPKVFGQQGPAAKIKRMWRMLFRSRYRSGPLRRVLSQAFGDQTLQHAAVRLVIPAFDVRRGTGILMKTPHCKDYTLDGSRTFVEVALSTAAAPTYFPIAVDRYGNLLVDGGMLANDPALLAMIEATVKLKWPQDQVRILSIGTTKAAFPKPPSSLLGWALASSDIFMAGQAWTVQGTLKLALKDAYHRVNPDVQPGRFNLDRIDRIDELVKLGEREAECHSAVISPFFGGQSREWGPYAQETSSDAAA